MRMVRESGKRADATLRRQLDGESFAVMECGSNVGIARNYSLDSHVMISDKISLAIAFYSLLVAFDAWISSTENKFTRQFLRAYLLMLA